MCIRDRLDIDIKAAAEAALGKELTQNLLSVVFDYDGNLWFATGGFRIYPERQQQGVLDVYKRQTIWLLRNIASNMIIKRCNPLEVFQNIF